MFPKLGAPKRFPTEVGSLENSNGSYANTVHVPGIKAILETPSPTGLFSGLHFAFSHVYLHPSNLNNFPALLQLKKKTKQNNKNPS